MITIKETLYCGGSWWLSPLSKWSLNYLLNCSQLDEFVLFHAQAVSDELSSCLIIHQFLNPEDDSRALISL